MSVARIRTLSQARARLASLRGSTLSVEAFLHAQFPGGSTQINNVFDPLLAEFDTAIAAVNTAISNTNPTSAEKTAYADAAINAAKAGQEVP